MKVTSQIHDHDEGPERQKGRRVEDPPAHRKIREQWPDMLRVAGSLVTNQVRAYDLLRMFGREGHPTPLGQGSPSTAASRRPSASLTWSTRWTTPAGAG
jgi:hypothetical protein